MVLLTLAGIFMMVSLNSLSGKSCLSVSWRSASGDIACSLVWNIFHCFFIFFDSLCCFQNSQLLVSWQAWPGVGDEPCWSVWPCLLVVSNFCAAPFFVLGGSQGLRVSVPQWSRSHSTWKQVRSWSPGSSWESMWLGRFQGEMQRWALLPAFSALGLGV